MNRVLKENENLMSLLQELLETAVSLPIILICLRLCILGTEKQDSLYCTRYCRILKTMNYFFLKKLQSFLVLFIVTYDRNK